MKTFKQFISAFKKSGLDTRYTKNGLKELHHYLEYSLYGNYDLIPSELADQYSEYKNIVEYWSVHPDEIGNLFDVNRAVVIMKDGSFINDNH